MTSVVRPISSMRIKAFGANLPSVTSGGCTGSLTAARSGTWKATRKPPARPPVSNARRESFSEVFLAVIMGPSSRLPLRGGLLDGLADPHIGAATADVAGHCGVDVGIIGIGRRRQ